MRNILSSTLIGFTLIFASSARAQESLPTKESVLELIRLNDVGASLDIIKKDIESSTQASVRRAFAGETLSERQENILAEMGAQAAAIFKEDLGAESLERDFVEIYRKALTQPEVDGLIAFYKTDAGKALLVKMPAVSQQTIRITLARLQGLTPKLNVMQSEIIRRMREEK